MKKKGVSTSNNGVDMTTNMKRVNINEICQKAPALLESILNKKPESITGVTKEGEEWKVLAEVLERKAIPDTQDILSTYEVKLTSDLEFTGYKRVGMRHRGEMVVEEEE
ncbi:MAG: gas vesicle protein GvpO [Candidatus Methanoperedens sp.]|nr:gas vesicle protein GvpO [Candidatus Methanoperedens sp.]